jgi:hypothetical protein
MYVPRMILSIAQCVWNLTKAFWYCLLFHPTTKGFLWSLLVGMKLRHTCLIYFAKSEIGPQGDASHTFWSRCASVWNVYNFLILIFLVLLWSWISPFLDEMPFIRRYGLCNTLKFASLEIELKWVNYECSVLIKYSKTKFHWIKIHLRM